MGRAAAAPHAQCLALELPAELMKRTFAADVEACTACGRRMELRALVTAPASVQRFLRHLSEPLEPPLSPARDPPSYRSRVLRRGAIEVEPQPDAFCSELPS